MALPAAAVTLIGPGVNNGSFESPAGVGDWDRKIAYSGWNPWSAAFFFAGYIMPGGGSFPEATDGLQTFQPYSVHTTPGYWFSEVIATPVPAGNLVTLSVDFGWDGSGVGANGWRGYLGQRVKVWAINPVDGVTRSASPVVTLTSHSSAGAASMPAGAGPAPGNTGWVRLTDWGVMEHDGWYLMVEGETGNLDGTISTVIGLDYDMSWGHYIDNVVLEHAASTQPILLVTPDARTVSALPGSTTFDVDNIGAGTMNWTATVTSGGNWLSISAGASGTNAGSVTVMANANTGGERNGSIEVTAAGVVGSPQFVTVVQAAGLSIDPDPYDGQILMTGSPVLGWQPGSFAVSHDVYFGTDYDSVNNADLLSGDMNGDGIVDAIDAWHLAQQWLAAGPGAEQTSADLNDSTHVDYVDYAVLAGDWGALGDGVYKGHFPSSGNSFNPGSLEPDTTYYWRIDEVTASGNRLKGEVWDFTTVVPYHVYDIMLDDDAIAYATYRGGNQKVISNARGIFTTHNRTASGNYTNQQWRLSRSTDGGQTFTTVYESTTSSHPPILETDANDNIYVIDHPTTLSRFMDGAGFSSPLTTAIPNGYSGKYAMLIDETRGRIYYITQNQWFHVRGMDGSYIDGYPLLQGGAHAFMMYPTLTMDEHGDLYAGWFTQRNGAYLYRSVHAIKSADGGATWTKLDGSTPLTTPIVSDDSGPTDRISDNDELAMHTCLSGFMAKDGKLHCVYWVDKPHNEYRYKRYSYGSDVPDIDANPFFDSGESPKKGNHGALAANLSVPGSTFYLVTTTDSRTRQICFASDDNGVTWYRYVTGDASYPINAVGGHGIYVTNTARDLTDDGCIIGSFTEVADFAVSYFEPDSGKAHFFKIQGGLSSVNILSAIYSAGSLTINFDQVRGNPTEICFGLGAGNWTSWQPFNTAMVVPLPNAPMRYQLKSSLDVVSQPQEIAF